MVVVEEERDEDADGEGYEDPLYWKLPEGDEPWSVD